MIDIHLHIDLDSLEINQDHLVQRLEASGVNGAFILSVPPAGFLPKKPAFSPEQRLENLMEWCDGQESLYPFFWIDPTANDASRQVEKAIAAGVAGFKIICDHFHPSDDGAMKIYQVIADSNKPILFHSGILWDGKPSSKYNRPVEFEPLLEISGLRFALAHISWPWCDEVIALYGKFLNAYTRNPEISAELFVDTTPGTPEIYRRDALTKLFTVYDISGHVMFGSDNRTLDYSCGWAEEWSRKDRFILEDIGIDNGVMDKYFTENALHFLGR